MDKDFEMLSTKEQREKLEKVLDSINRLNVASGKINIGDISDITFSRKDNGDVAYVLTITKPDGTTEKEIYEEKFEETIDGHQRTLAQSQAIDDETISKYALLGYSTNELEEQKAEFDRILNSNEYSLSKIYQNEQEIRTIATMLNIPEAEIETLITVNGSTQLGDLDKLGVHEAGIEEVKETAEDLGIVAQDVQNYTTVDNKGEVKLDANKLDSKGIQSNEISGNDKITTFYSMNNILGQNYASYRIIKSVSGTSFILGINEDGTTERIEDNSLQIDSTKSMSLMREDGSLENVGVVISFSIKDPGSKYNGKELVGLYNDNGNIGAYYGRKELDGAILGKSVEQGRIINQGNEARQKSMLDTKTNSDISGEASSAYDRTADGCNSNVYYVASVPDKDRDELIEECSKHFGIDEDDLRDAVEEKTRDEHDENKTDEKIVEEAAVELSKESDDLEDPDDPSNDDEPEHVHGTPWGNPNTLY